MAELCVQFTSSHSSCPVAYDFSLVLVNMEGSASKVLIPSVVLPFVHQENMRQCIKAKFRLKWN